MNLRILIAAAVILFTSVSISAQPTPDAAASGSKAASSTSVTITDVEFTVEITHGGTKATSKGKTVMDPSCALTGTAGGATLTFIHYRGDPVYEKCFASNGTTPIEKVTLPVSIRTVGTDIVYEIVLKKP